MKLKNTKQSRLNTYLNNPTGALWTLAIPIMIGMGIQTVYTLVDIIFIGRLGDMAIAAVAFNMPLMFMIMGLTVGLGSGVTASVARFIGRKDKANADNSAEHAVIMGLVISAVLATAGLLFGHKILSILGCPPELLDVSWGYLKVISVGLPMIIFSAFFRSILVGEGDTRFPMVVAAIGTVLNIILDPIFIFVLDLGVKGAAIATVISQTLVFFIFVFMLYVKKHSYINFRIKHFQPQWMIITDILRVGIPASISMVVMSVGQAVFNRILVSYSPQTVAAYQISGRVDMVVLLPILSIGAAMTTLVGMFYGAQEISKLKTVVRYGYSRAVGITFVSTILIISFAPVITRAFTHAQEVRQIAITYLRTIPFVYPLIAIGITSGRILQGFGKGLPVLIITSIRVLVLSAPLALLFSIGMDKPVHWVWYAMIIASVVSTILALSWIRVTFKNLPHSPDNKDETIGENLEGQMSHATLK